MFAINQAATARIVKKRYPSGEVVLAYGESLVSDGGSSVEEVSSIGQVCTHPEGPPVSYGNHRGGAAGGVT